MREKGKIVRRIKGMEECGKNKHMCACRDMNSWKDTNPWIQAT